MFASAKRWMTLALALAMLAYVPNLASGKSQSTAKTCVWEKICPSPVHVGHSAPQVKTRIGFTASADEKLPQVISFGQWVAIEEVLETDEWEVVYNLRIADYHTYFVTDWNWGFSAWSHNVIYGTQETPNAHNGTYPRVPDDPAITDPANALLVDERNTRGMVAAGSAGDECTLAFVRVGSQQFFAANDTPVTYTWPTVGTQPGNVPGGEGVNIVSRSHAEVKSMLVAHQAGASLAGQAITIFTDRDPCRYCDRTRGIENAARILGARSVMIWCPSGGIGPIIL